MFRLFKHKHFGGSFSDTALSRSSSRNRSVEEVSMELFCRGDNQAVPTMVNEPLAVRAHSQLF